MVAEFGATTVLYDLARMANYLARFVRAPARRAALMTIPSLCFLRAGLRSVSRLTSWSSCANRILLVGSWWRLGWKFDFQDLLGQALLRRDLLATQYEPEMQDLIGSPDRLAQIALLWRATYDAVHRIRDEVPGLQVIRYEDLSREPMERFRLLYDAFRPDVDPQDCRAGGGRDLQDKDELTGRTPGRCAMGCPAPHSARWTARRRCDRRRG